MSAIRSHSGILIAATATALFAFLISDALGDPLIGALMGVLAFTIAMPLVAIAETPRRLRHD